jgi:hypothetical protein
MPTAARKRPWYLVLALLGALALGSSGASTGWTRMVLYRQPIDPSFESDDIADQAEREAIVTRTRAWLQALDDAKPRGWPLGVASLVLGGAVFVFAMRTLGGNPGARTALVQLVVAQAALGIVDYWLLRDVWDLTARLEGARLAALAHEHLDPAMLSETAMSMPIAVGLQTLASALVVLGLTRRRSRRFFEARAEALGEP